jgi:hypothetical protein
MSAKKRGKRPGLRARSKNARKVKAKVVNLTMDRATHEKLDGIARDAYTDIPTVAQVLLATGMHMGRNSSEAALRDSVSRILELQSRLGRCREIMEVNDPVNARDIFGPPLSHSQSESAVAEGATPNSTPSIEKLAMELGSQP